MTSLARFFMGIVLLFLLGATITPASAGRWNPDDEWFTVQVDSIYFHYTAHGSPFMSDVIRYTDMGYAAMESYFGYRVEPLHVVIVDQKDVANGFFAPFPNRIYIYLTAPQNEEFSSYSESWLQDLIIHELAHAFHINRVTGWPAKLRDVFGEAILPAAIVPLHITEGIATYLESHFTGGGRGHNPHFRMKLKAPLIADDFWSYSQMGYPGRAHLPGDRPYVAGYFWMDFLHETYGRTVFSDIIDRQVKRPWLGIGKATEYVVGESNNRLYDDFVSLWRANVIAELNARTRESMPLPIKVPLDLPPDHLISRPIFVDSNRLLAYYYDYDTTPALVEIDLTKKTMTSRYSTRLSNERGFDYHPATDKLLVSEIHTDLLYQTEQIAHGFLVQGVVDSTVQQTIFEMEAARHAQHVRLSPDGTQVAMTRSHGPYNNLWLTNLETGKTRQLTNFQRSMIFDPTWSPEGKFIVFSRQKEGRQDLAVLELATGLTVPLTDDGQAKFAPAFSPNGDYLAFVADDEGAFNIYVMNLNDPQLRQVTNVVTGAFDPVFSPDGQRLYFTIYRETGHDLHFVTFKPEQLPVATLPTESSNLSSFYVSPITKPRAYNARSHLKPRFWVPVPFTPGAGVSPGAFTMGMDPLERQNWYAFGAFSATDDRILWDIAYENAYFFPRFYVHTATDHFSRNFDLYDGHSVSSVDYKQRDTSIQFGANMNLSLESNVTVSGLGSNIGYRFKRRSDITEEIRLDLPEGNVAGIYTSWRWFRGQQTRRDIAFVGQSAYTFWAFDRAFWGSDFHQTDFLLSLVSNYRVPTGKHHLVQFSYYFRRFASPLLLDDDVWAGQLTGNQPRSIKRWTRHNLAASFLFPIWYIDQGWGNWPFFLNRLSGRLVAGYSINEYEQARSDDRFPFLGALLKTDATIFYGLDFDVTTGFYFNVEDGNLSPTIQLDIGLPSAPEQQQWRNHRRDARPVVPQ